MRLGQGGSFVPSRRGMTKADATVCSGEAISAHEACARSCGTTCSCPERHCSQVCATTMPPKRDSGGGGEDEGECSASSSSSSSSSTALISSLARYEHGGLTMIELLGPSDPADAAAIVLTATHGGSLRTADDVIPQRTTSGPYCSGSGGCQNLKDSYTKELAIAVQKKVADNYCKVPYVVVNHLHRSRLDANRDIGEAAQGSPVAEEAWWAFRNFTVAAQDALMLKFGSVLNTRGEPGVPGLLVDVHGYAGKDWNFTMWGYGLSSSSLDPSNYCPVDERSSFSTGTNPISTFHHARYMPGQSLECLIRGPGSLGARMEALPGLGMCGAGLPSPRFPSPKALANSCQHCADMCSESDPKPCHYFSGGYTSDIHSFLDWQGQTGTRFAAVQAELPRCVRFGDATTHDLFADRMSTALCSFLRDLFGAGLGTC